MGLSTSERRAKLRALATADGHSSVDALLASAVADDVCPAICTAPGCNYTCEMEPDQDRGWCEACGQNTVQSALVLAGLI